LNSSFRIPLGHAKLAGLWAAWQFATSSAPMEPRQQRSKRLRQKQYFLWRRRQLPCKGVPAAVAQLALRSQRAGA